MSYIKPITRNMYALTVNYHYCFNNVNKFNGQCDPYHESKILPPI